MKGRATSRKVFSGAARSLGNLRGPIPKYQGEQKAWYLRGLEDAARGIKPDPFARSSHFGNSSLNQRAYVDGHIRHSEIRKNPSAGVRRNPTAGLSLWVYNPITGYWQYARGVTPETAERWLKIFSDDEPGKVFKVAKHRPKTSPIQRVRKNPSARARGLADEAAHRFEAFTGHTATKEMRTKVRPIRVGLAVGKLSGVMYEATRDGKTEQYFHRFKKSSRPLLVADHDGSQIGIVGGRYRFTDRGIVDD